jgi:hypothetical protein
MEHSHLIETELGFRLDLVLPVMLKSGLEPSFHRSEAGLAHMPAKALIAGVPLAELHFDAGKGLMLEHAAPDGGGLALEPLHAKRIDHAVLEQLLPSFGNVEEYNSH